MFSINFWDFNSKLLERPDGFHHAIGRNILAHPSLSWSDISEQVIDNRTSFLEFVCDCDLRVASTFFEKPAVKTVTRKHYGVNGNLYNAHAGCADQIDFILTSQQWENACMDAHSLVETYLDHFSLFCAFKIRFKKHEQVSARNELGRALDEQDWPKYNEEIKE